MSKNRCSQQNDFVTAPSRVWSNKAIVLLDIHYDKLITVIINAIFTFVDTYTLNNTRNISIMTQETHYNENLIEPLR